MEMRSIALIRGYKTPESFRQALEARLRDRAHAEGLDLEWLRRQVAFERFLARVFHGPEPVWLLKGGYALELRLEGRIRTTLDIDLASADTEMLRFAAAAEPGEQTLDVALAHLQELASRELGDHFTFTVTRLRTLGTPPEGGLRCTAECRVAGRRFTNFRVDFGLGDPVVSEPEWVSGQSLLMFAGIEPYRVPLLPVTQQIAEKFHAYTAPWEDRHNTRSKDLVDLLLLFEMKETDRNLLRKALQATFSHRNTHPLPAHLPSPPDEWKSEFAELATHLGLPSDTLADAFRYLEAVWDEWGLGAQEDWEADK